MSRSDKKVAASATKAPWIYRPSAVSSSKKRLSHGNAAAKQSRHKAPSDLARHSPYWTKEVGERMRTTWKPRKIPSKTLALLRNQIVKAGISRSHTRKYGMKNRGFNNSLATRHRSAVRKFNRRAHSTDKNTDKSTHKRAARTSSNDSKTLRAGSCNVRRPMKGHERGNDKPHAMPTTLKSFKKLFSASPYYPYVAKTIWKQLKDSGQKKIPTNLQKTMNRPSLYNNKEMMKLDNFNASVTPLDHASFQMSKTGVIVPWETLIPESRKSWRNCLQSDGTTLTGSKLSSFTSNIDRLAREEPTITLVIRSSSSTRKEVEGFIPGLKARLTSKVGSSTLLDPPKRYWSKDFSKHRDLSLAIAPQSVKQVMLSKYPPPANKRSSDTVGMIQPIRNQPIPTGLQSNASGRTQQALYHLANVLHAYFRKDLAAKNSTMDSVNAYLSHGTMTTIEKIPRSFKRVPQSSSKAILAHSSKILANREQRVSAVQGVSSTQPRRIISEKNTKPKVERTSSENRIKKASSVIENLRKVKSEKSSNRKLPTSKAFDKALSNIKLSETGKFSSLMKVTKESDNDRVDGNITDKRKQTREIATSTTAIQRPECLTKGNKKAPKKEKEKAKITKTTKKKGEKKQEGKKQEKNEKRKKAKKNDWLENLRQLLNASLAMDDRDASLQKEVDQLVELGESSDDPDGHWAARILKGGKASGKLPILKRTLTKGLLSDVKCKRTQKDISDSNTNKCDDQANTTITKLFTANKQVDTIVGKEIPAEKVVSFPTTVGVSDPTTEPVVASNAIDRTDVNTDGVVIELSTEGVIDDTKTEGLGTDVKTEGLGTDVKREGLGTDVNTEGLGTDVNTEGLGTDVNTEGLGTDVKTEGLGTDVNTEGLGTDVNTEGLGTDVNTEGLGTDVKTEGLFSEGQVDGLGTDVKTEGLFSEGQVDGLACVQIGLSGSDEENKSINWNHFMKDFWINSFSPPATPSVHGASSDDGSRTSLRSLEVEVRSDTSTRVHRSTRGRRSGYPLKPSPSIPSIHDYVHKDGSKSEREGDDRDIKEHLWRSMTRNEVDQSKSIPDINSKISTQKVGKSKVSRKKSKSIKSRETSNHDDAAKPAGELKGKLVHLMMRLETLKVDPEKNEKPIEEARRKLEKAEEKALKACSKRHKKKEMLDAKLRVIKSTPSLKQPKEETIKEYQKVRGFKDEVKPSEDVPQRSTASPRRTTTRKRSKELFFDNSSGMGSNHHTTSAVQGGYPEVVQIHSSGVVRKRTGTSYDNQRKMKQGSLPPLT